MMEVGRERRDAPYPNQIPGVASGVFEGVSVVGGITAGCRDKFEAKWSLEIQ